MMSAGCALIGASSFAAMALVRIDAFFVCLLVMGGASAVFMTSALAAVVDLGEPGKRLRDMSMYQAANMVGASMGPAIGGVAAGMWGFSAPFLINGVVALVGVLAFAMMPWPKTDTIKRVEPPKSGGLGRLARQGVGIGLMYFSIFYVRVASNWILMPLIAQTKYNYELTTIGLILTSGAIANLIVLTTVGPLVRIFGRIPAHASGLRHARFWRSSGVFVGDLHSVRRGGGRRLANAQRLCRRGRARGPARPRDGPVAHHAGFVATAGPSRHGASKRPLRPWIPGRLARLPGAPVGCVNRVPPGCARNTMTCAGP